MFQLKGGVKGRRGSRCVWYRPFLVLLEDRYLLSFIAASSYLAGSEVGSIQLEDFNGDGIPDLAMLHSNGVSVALGQGDGSFQTPITSAAGASLTSLAAGDFDEDGLPDLAVTHSASSGTVSILLGNGDGTF